MSYAVQSAADTIGGSESESIQYTERSVQWKIISSVEISHFSLG